MPDVKQVLAGFRGQLDAVRREAEALVGGMSAAQVNWRPAPEAWSAGDVLQHLCVTNASYLATLDAVLARAAGRSGGGEWRPSWIGGALARSLEPPPKRRFRAPRPWRVAHAPDRDPAAALEAHRRSLDALAATIGAAEGIDLRRARLGSPALPLLRVNAGDAFAILLAHERRHLWQIRKLREAPGFPSA